MPRWHPSDDRCRYWRLLISKDQGNCELLWLYWWLSMSIQCYDAALASSKASLIVMSALSETRLHSARSAEKKFNEVLSIYHFHFSSILMTYHTVTFNKYIHFYLSIPDSIHIPNLSCFLGTPSLSDQSIPSVIFLFRLSPSNCSWAFPSSPFSNSVTLSWLKKPSGSQGPSLNPPETVCPSAEAFTVGLKQKL